MLIEKLSQYTYFLIFVLIFILKAIKNINTPFILIEIFFVVFDALNKRDLFRKSQRDVYLSSVFLCPRTVIYGNVTSKWKRVWEDLCIR